MEPAWLLIAMLAAFPGLNSGMVRSAGIAEVARFERYSECSLEARWLQGEYENTRFASRTAIRYLCIPVPMEDR